MEDFLTKPFVTLYMLIRKQCPQRSLIDLVDSGMYPRQDLLRRISCISLFKAPASWNLAAGNLNSTCDSHGFLSERVFVRAKFASGVPLLMATVSNSALTTSSTWGSRKHRHPKPTRNASKARKLVRIIVGNQKCKSS